MEEGEMAQAASFRALSPLPGDVASKAYGMSREGLFVVGASYDAQGTWQAVRWLAGSGAATALGKLPNDLFSEAHAVSDNGGVVVGVSGHEDVFEAFVWNQQRGMQRVGQGIDANACRTVSRDGTMLAGEANGGFDSRAFYGLVQLPFLISDRKSGVFAVDGKITALCGWQAGGAADVPVWWKLSPGHFTVELLPLPKGADGGVAFAVSDDASTFGGSTSPAGENGVATLWRLGEDPEVLGALDTDVDSVVMGVSGDGEVVAGQSGLKEGTAFLWDRVNRMRALRDVLVAAGLGPALAGWTLESANAISTNGAVVAGIGTNPQGAEQAFVATLP
jgi:uncharacterized membrane protein